MGRYTNRGLAHLSLLRAHGAHQPAAGATLGSAAGVAVEVDFIAMLGRHYEAPGREQPAANRGVAGGASQGGSRAGKALLGILHRLRTWTHAGAHGFVLGESLDGARRAGALQQPAVVGAGRGLRIARQRPAATRAVGVLGIDEHGLQHPLGGRVQQLAEALRQVLERSAVLPAIALPAAKSAASDYLRKM